MVETLWPDVVGPFAEIVPNGCQLVMAEDGWSRRDALRRRAVELLPRPGAPSLPELLEEAQHDAFREGWTELEDGTYELENVNLTLTAREGRFFRSRHQRRHSRRPRSGSRHQRLHHAGAALVAQAGDPGGQPDGRQRAHR